MYNDIKHLKLTEINLLENNIKNILEEFPVEFEDYFKKFLFNDAKRLRPLCIFLVCDLLDIQIDDDILNLASGIEILHNASLIHDDILDDGILRRNMPCIHIENGYKAAVLAGDYLLSLAMHFFSKIPAAIDIMANTSYKMTKSEINSLNKRFTKPDIDEYIENIKNKTSSLFTNGILAVEKIKNIKIPLEIINFIENFAIIFQLKDDMNNFLNKDTNKLSSDKEEGIYTFPLIINEVDKQKRFLDDLICDTKNLIRNYPNSNILISLIDTIYEG